MSSTLMKYFRHIRLRIIIVCSLIIISFLQSCDEEEAGLPDHIYEQVVATVKSALGDTLSTSDLISLIIPPDALLEDGTVFLGQTGYEPTIVPNADLQVVGTPITIKIPTATIRKPLQLSFPVNSTSIDVNNFFIFLFNGKTYFPVEYSIDDNLVTVNIDLLDWEETGNKSTAILSEIVILGLINKQTPSPEEMGLKKVSIDENETMSYAQPSANSSSKVLLLVHGWLANSNRWINFLQDIREQENQLYSEYWTFSYNSAWSIEQNAELLYDAVETYANGAEIDIVAHSMGGLVSRSMLETFNGDIYINKLITLGTPHHGSPLAVFRYVFGAIISMENSDNSLIYNYYNQGFRDLDTNSDFIQQMKNLEEMPIPYFTIACTNDPKTTHAVIASELLEGSDDGIVQVSSAKSVEGAEIPDTDVMINTDFAHMEMPNDDLIFDQVMNYLNKIE
ncbi:hypothetical protein ES705_25916 [subsurface metagenome]